MSNWAKYKLSELGEIVGGATPSTSREDFYGGDISWLTPKDLSSFNGRYISKGERNITETGYKSCSAKMLPKGSILFTSRAPIGYVAIAANEICTNQGFKSIIPYEEKIDNVFLYYLLLFNKNNIESMGSGTTFKEVSGATMKNIEVSCPSLDEQKRIAEVLNSLDDKIELNNRINANLEAQVQAIFKSWFVDFEPWGGTMPNDWREVRIKELIDSTLGGDWGKETPEDNFNMEVYCIRGADIPDVAKGNKGKMPTRYILNRNYQAKRLAEFDIVVEISGGSPTQSTGRVAIITNSLLAKYENRIVCTNFCRAMKPIQKYSLYLYYYWQFLYTQGKMFSYENGTTGIKNLDINGLINSEYIVMPDDDILLKFNDIALCISNELQNNGLQSEELSNLRDTLLPKLLSGELTVDYAQL